jgi:subtilisin family serine protease
MRRALAILSPLLILAGPAASRAQDGVKLSPALRAALAGSRPGDVHLVWAYFLDKGPRPEDGLGQARMELTARALSRRALRGDAPELLGFEDLPLVPGYVQGVFAHVLRPRQQSRWLNAVSAEATAEQVRAVAGLAFVERLDLVRRYRRTRDERPEPEARAAGGSGAREGHAYDYGSSLGQLQQIKVPSVHDKGLSGEGVVIAVFDAGFNNLAHRAFAGMRIEARRDFVNGDGDVGDGPDMGEGSHGTQTLSAIGGFDEGQLVGPAFAATYLLAKTENTDSETPVEEDNWAAAVEWAEGRGADVITSSLGYLTFDMPNTSYTWEDMDGKTAISTRAAEKAASLGVVVVNSAGNAGFHASRNTLGAPSDGKRVLAVAAVSSSGSRAAFSSVGPSADGRVKPDLAAQGVAVKLASPFSTSGYVLGNGTSFSCPLTAGVAALVLEAHPSYNVKQVLAVLRSTASKAKSPDRLLGYGIVNALKAVQAKAPAK